jgi:uncharacterized membrane protein YgcG
MAKILRKMLLKGGLLWCLILFCFSGIVSAQGTRQNVADSIKEAQDAGVPPTTLDHLLSTGYVNQVDPTAMAGFIQTLIEVKQEKLPLEPFANKIEEGMAKQVPVPVIHQVLMKKKEDYLFTRTTLREMSKGKGKDQAIPNEHFVRLAESLSCGISRENMRHYLEQAPSSSTSSQLAMTVEIAASLQQNKFNPEMTQRIVMTGLKQNYFTPETRDFARVIVTAQRKGVPDQKIMNTALNAIQKRDSVRSMATHLGVTEEDLSYGPMVASDQGKMFEEHAEDGHRGGGTETHEGMGSDRKGHGGSGGEGGHEGEHGESGSDEGGRDHDSGGGGHESDHGGGEGDGRD